jgi:AcrR family transcriptional regulator
MARSALAKARNGRPPRAAQRSGAGSAEAAPIAVTPAGPARERLLRAAEQVFALKGYAGASTQEIAAQAGLQKRMLFYYFSGKEELYTQVLDGFLQGIRDIHVRFHGDPGPIGLQEIIAGLTRFVAANPDPVRILIREIMDDGPHLARVVERYVGPLFADGLAETQRNMDRGIFGRDDPMHALVNIGGITVFYLLIAPLLRQVWHRDPLAPDTLEERIVSTVRFALRGLMAENGEGTGAAARRAPQRRGGAAEQG